MSPFRHVVQSGELAATGKSQHQLLGRIETNVPTAIFAFNETFECAARLANTEAGDETMTIAIAVGGLKDR